MGSVLPIRPQAEKFSLPRFLTEKKRYTIWKQVPKPNGKVSKIPFYVSGEARRHKHGSDLDVASLTDFDTALDKCLSSNGQFMGIQHAPLMDDGVVFIDVDGPCVNEDGEIHEFFVKLFSPYYCEISPSGKGLRVALLSDELKNARFKFTLDGVEYGFEVFRSSGQVTITGNQTWMTQLSGYSEEGVEAQSELIDFYNSHVTKRVSDPEEVPIILGMTDEEIWDVFISLRDDLGYHPWLMLGMATHFETKGRGFHLWNDWSATSEENYTGEESLRNKWDGFSFGANSVSGEYIRELGAKCGVYPKAPGYAQYFDVIELTKDEFDRIETTSENAFRLKTVGEFKQRKSLSWFIKNWIPRGEMGMIIGQPSAGKSNAALSMGASIALS